MQHNLKHNCQGKITSLKHILDSKGGIICNNNKSIQLSGLTGGVPGLHQWALVPGQRLLEGLREVEQAPANDDIVVEGHEKAHLPREADNWLDMSTLSP